MAWDIDSEGRYGVNNTDAIITELLLNNLADSDSGPDITVSCEAAEADGPQLLSRWITDLPNEPFALIRRIPVIVEEHAPQEYTARFREANIAMSGESIEEVQLNLAAHILDLYETLRNENPELLGPEPQRQLGILRQYLRDI